MAVDANVLIYERIREELKAGKSILAAIDAGFKRAWGTIIDSHLTQLIAAIVLYFLGSGPVQGFAVTLALGILTSLFTSYTVTLYFVGWWYRVRRPKTLKIQVFRFIPDGTKIPFMKISRFAIIFSILISIGAIGSAFTKGFNLGIDFIGGSAIEMQYAGTGAADAGAIRDALDELGAGRSAGAGLRPPRTTSSSASSCSRVATPSSRRPSTRSPQTLGDDRLRRAHAPRPSAAPCRASSPTKGVIAVLVALGAILIYVWFRFEWQFALAAITTTTHDVIMTIGLFSIRRARVQHHVDRGRADAGGPQSQRDGRHLRPNSREPAQVQEDVAARADRSLDQPDDRANLADAVHHSAGAVPAGVLRRRSHPRLHHRHDLRLDLRHVLVGVHRRPDPHLLRAQSAQRRAGRRQGEDPKRADGAAV